MEALKNLSFDAYIEDVEAEYRDHQVQSKSKEKTKGSKLEQSGLTEEELLRQQEELFERARIRMNSSSTPAYNEAEITEDCLDTDTINATDNADNVDTKA